MGISWRMVRFPGAYREIATPAARSDSGGRLPCHSQTKDQLAELLPIISLKLILPAIGDSDDIQAENRVIINGGTLSLGDGEDGIQSGNATEMNGGTVTSVK